LVEKGFITFDHSKADVFVAQIFEEILEFLAVSVLETVDALYFFVYQF
jgi:hypothetical protein